MNLRRTLIGGLALALLATAACSDSTVSDGVDWMNYPAAALVPAEAALAAPDEATSAANGEAITQQIVDRLSAIMELNEWQEAEPATMQPFGPNGYGGDSLLVYYVGEQWESPTPLATGTWADIIDGAGEVAESESFSMAQEGVEESSWRTAVTFQRGLESVEVSVQDARLDEEQSELVDAHGGLVAGITVTYRSATVADDSREQFEDEIQPYIGLTPPPPTE